MPTAPIFKPGPIDIEVGQLIRIKMLRADDMSKSDLARATGISRSMISEMLNGNKAITMHALDIMCRAIPGVKFREIVLEADENTRKRRLS